ncbi:hypothetical protein SMACR_03953 [Sordaria macrospora]|uniref:WGS project CABT00000000 data, contig 2.17 n=2 Tax=Sordaria macrospora TaxID=5147 RepID=F7W0E8_SORMK|nr:uncharacterized protein SMAC_03953 [Sordaria macrospora k-hell]KAA8634999.1 hypothetical protein SMACR_03953 [Sordaria macrospora]WPJ60310.1 hypothetical protein SMAC4_03953 [Sordaria macrospora]CCC11248.1 unnamed protein product [Sordaria macrospora k-hell]
MDQPISEPAGPAAAPDVNLNRPPAVVRKRSNSGTGGLLSRFPFMRASSDQHRPRARRGTNENDSKPSASPTSSPTTSPPIPSFRTIPSTSNTYTGNSGAGSSLYGSAPPLSHAALHQQTILQQKTRRRRGSLRKVALLGRGAQRERRESYPLSINTQFELDRSNENIARASGSGSNIITSSPGSIIKENSRNGGFGLGISGISSQPSASMEESDSEGTYTAKGTSSSNITSPSMMSNGTDDPAMTSPTISYTTTDDEDALHMASSRGPGIMHSLSRSSTNSSISSLNLLHPARASVSSSTSDSYFQTMPTSRPTRGTQNTPGSNGTSSATATSNSIQGRRRSSVQQQRAKSPLSLTTPMPPQEAVDYYDDYSDTEFWGWIILLCTWITFVIGMGSCFGVWSWAWDVGTTPYAPPEFEDDPTLPIVGYYPALFVLTWMMVWVWVSVSWVGMKYFRHARVGGD